MRASAIVAIAWGAACAPPSTTTDAGTAPPPADPRLFFLTNETPELDPNAYVEATSARYADPIAIALENVAPGASVEIIVRAYGGLSTQTFIARDDGTIETHRDAPTSGGYAGVDVDGPIWTGDGTTAPSNPPDLTLHVRATIAGDVELQGEIERRYINDGLIQERVDDGARVGTLSIPPGEGPFPALLVFGGSEGGRESGEFVGAYLSSLGYATFGVAYFGETGLPPLLELVPIEILLDDLAFLAADPRVDPSRIGVWGASRGGELALLLGAKSPLVKAVVASVPSGYVWGANAPDDASAWSLDDAGVPYVQGLDDVGFTIVVDDAGVDHVYGSPVFDATINGTAPEALAAAEIHVEDIDGPFLLLAAADDQIWPSCALSQVAWNRAERTGHTDAHADEFHCYPEAGHFLFMPGGSTMQARESFQVAWGGFLVYGGQPAGIAAAQRASDTAMRGFLRAAFLE